MTTILPTSEQDELKLCKNCKYIATNHNYDATKYKCFAPENQVGIDLVTGDKILRFDSCYKARDLDINSCNPEGIWYKVKEIEKEEILPVFAPQDIESIAKAASNKLASIRAKRFKKSDFNSL